MRLTTTRATSPIRPPQPGSNLKPGTVWGTTVHPTYGCAALLVFVISETRLQEYEGIIRSVSTWALNQVDIRGVAVVGSWARGTPSLESDVDLIVLTEAPERYIKSQSWIVEALGQEGTLVRTQRWGPVTERRVQVVSGLEIEFGFASVSWASTEPVDTGTVLVVRDGCRPMVDDARLFDSLKAATQ
jgi:predicted nucleotidyltransferase